MSNLNEESSIHGNIIKLKVGGTNRVVNTIEDQKTERGVSLVCPFPALEVDIPISFTSANGEQCEGKIHRIGVEDDPTTGLPKLRLSVRNDKTDRETVVETLYDELIAESSGLSPVPQEFSALETFELPCAEDQVNMPSKTQVLDAEGVDIDIIEGVDIDVDADFEEDDSATTLFSYRDDEISMSACSELEVDESTLLKGILDEEVEYNNTSELLSLDDIDDMQKTVSKEPQWVSYTDMPIPSEVSQRSQTRRRRRAVAVAAWMMVLGIATGGIFVLTKAGVIDLDAAKQYVSIDAADETTSSNSEALDALSEDSSPKVAVVQQHAGEKVIAVAQVKTATLATAEVAAMSHDAENVEPAVEPEETETETETSAAVETENLEEIVSSVPSAEVVLPTRWPAEFATAYRLQNPNGVVVDVPGGLVKREGWLTIKEDDQIIRSIKAVQRENGARFIVYVHGSLPNFKTTPKNGGIRLSLYYDAQEQTSSETQTVAMLEK